MYNDARARGLDYAPIWGLAVAFGCMMWFVPALALLGFYLYVRRNETGGRESPV